MTTIAIFGDSITHGVDDIDSGGWANRLMVLLWDKWDEYGANVYVLGIDGDTSSGLLVRLQSELASRVSDIVIIAIGLNDSIYFKEDGKVMIEEEDFQKNLLKIITLSQEYTKEIIFIGITPIVEHKLQPYRLSSRGQVYYSEQRAELFNALVQEVCKKENIKYISVYDTLNKEDLPDGLHPNSVGHKKMFERIRDFLVENVLEVK